MDVKSSVPKLAQCFICQAWRLERDLQPIEVPDQGGGYIQKLACKKCIDKIMGELGLQDKPGGGESKK
jgi:hypothetical protein